ncbi:MAG: SDR family oxidoreductase [Halobacteria archaeon]
MAKWVEGRSAIVTGALGLLGRTSAEALASEGARVACADSDSKVTEFAAELGKKHGVQTLGAVADPLNKEQVEGLVKRVVEGWGRVDILVCGYEYHRLDPILEMKNEAWHEVVNANLKSVFYACRAVIPHMTKQKYGRIVNFSAIEARIGSAFAGNPAGLGEAHFAAAKSAIIGFNHALSREVASLGVTVNAIIPGYMKDRAPAIPPDELKKRLPLIAAQRWCEPSDLAGAIILLASEKGGYINGDILTVGGGAYMTP